MNRRSMDCVLRSGMRKSDVSNTMPKKKSRSNTQIERHANDNEQPNSLITVGGNQMENRNDDNQHNANATVEMMENNDGQSTSGIDQTDESNDGVPPSSSTSYVFKFRL